MEEYSIKVLPEDSIRRLDLFIADFSQKNKLGFSREAIKKLISGGAVSLNGSNQLKPHHKIKDGDLIKITIVDKKESSLDGENIPLDIIYEDEDLAIINKQCGLVVHPAPGNYEHTMVNALLHHFKNLSSVDIKRPGIVHRLDKDTSGLIVIAKNNNAHLALVSQFAEHSIKRKYVALVKGKMEFDEGVIELPIGRHPFKRKSMAVVFRDDAREAKTFYRTIKRSEVFSLLELEPFTGRTHQLRVHLSHLGHPILGDTKYGKNNKFERLALHARYLGFIHPSTGKFVEFSTAIPEEFNKISKDLTPKNKS
ncbi:MAG: RluA family pseudouridine synthase [Candidatus Omnitrophica bacterium]|nr:RluA family pseudouridine synthase [Candidatus Omnitrophota bacterium]